MFGYIAPLFNVKIKVRSSRQAEPIRQDCYAAKEVHSQTNLDIQMVQVNFRRLYAFITKMLFQPLSAIDCNLSSISSIVKVLKKPV